MGKTGKEPLVIQKRSGDGSRIITIRIHEDTLAQLDKVAKSANYSRNELVNLLLTHGLENIEVR